MRLTEKYDSEYGSNINEYKLWQKLCQLEDIEEELGIDLVTFFKILRMFDSSIKNGVHGDSYCVFPDGTKLVTDMGYIEEFIKEFKKLIKNYGKTWSLTKEELL